MTLYKDCNSFAKKLQFFCNPILQPHHMKASRTPTPKCYTFLETFLDPQFRSHLRYKNFANFFATLFCKPILCHLLASRSSTTKFYTFLETSNDSWFRSQLRCKNFVNYFAKPQQSHIQTSRIWYWSHLGLGLWNFLGLILRLGLCPGPISRSRCRKLSTTHI